MTIPGLSIDNDHAMASFDVKSLFTNVPMAKTLEILKEKLNTQNPADRDTLLSVTSIVQLVEFCVNNAYLQYNQTFYRQTRGAAMGSPLSPVLADIFYGVAGRTTPCNMW
eukprot:scpid96164/ scgid14420/ 